MEQCKFLKEKIKACHTLVMKETLRKMKRVLRRLGQIDADNVVQTKGRVACEINTADELLCTELIFNGVFNDLDAAQAVSGFRLSFNFTRAALKATLTPSAGGFVIVPRIHG
jgi:ATP-dependent RNA helicase DOB1